MRAIWLLAAAAGCGAAFGRARPAHEPLAPIGLGQPAEGDTHDDDGWHMAICTGGGTVGVTSARAYRFVAPETASYRIELTAAYDAVVEVEDADSPRRDTLSCFGVDRDRGGVTVAMRKGGAYDLIVDGQMQARGAYSLAITRDDGKDAPVRAEDPAITRPLCAAAPALDGSAAGTFRSLPGGLRASCGGTGSGVAYQLRVPAGGEHVALAAQFPAVLELRRGCDGAVVTCQAGGYDVGVDVPEGDYLVIVDTSQVIDKPEDGRRGAGVLGAYWLEGKR